MTVFAGRYTLEQKLASGGMAEVFLARQAGVRAPAGDEAGGTIEGFEKLVVLKRILPHQSDNPEFVRMFLDEARIAADLSHPNVVNIFDAGKADGQYFITMEYLRGRDVASVFHETSRRREPLPLAVTLHCLIDAARGLHAAHTKTDLQGRPLKIVHRDVSPPNLFVTWDGVTKVLDFGIAHAATRSTKTEVGVVKGKLAYLSPEQLEAEELDGRSDQFALGIVAWELLTGQRLFQKPSDAEALRAILEHRVPAPSSLVPGLPEGVEAVVLKMLAARREDRFADCAAAADALEGWLDETKTPHSAHRVALALKALFPDPTARPTAAPALMPTKETVLPPKVDQTTKPARKRPSLPQEEVFLAAVSEFLQERPGRTNLLPPAGPFVGREADLQVLEAMLGEERTRLLTVTGFGGVGKTRLVRELAWRLRERWAGAGGAWFVDLAAARSADDVCKALAQALAVDVPLDAANDSVTQTGRTLRSLGPALVVLDNFEQVLDAAPRTVGAWLDLAPEVRFVVTSREALRLPGEHVHQLRALRTGGATSEAVQLFIARAQLVGAQCSASELGVIATLCERLEGHALAIELAAGQLEGTTVQALLERLSSPAAVLELGAGTGRHDTLWNTIDWSWRLLTPVEQSALAQLSVFRGGFTPESAVEVLDLTAFPLAPRRLEVVAALVRKSLLQHAVAPELPAQLRLGMLESVDEFATRQLEALGGTRAARARHAAHLLALGQEALEKLGTEKTEEAMSVLFVERRNLTEVFERALSTLPPTKDSATSALRALHVLEPVIQRTGPYASHLALLDDALRVGRSVGVEAETLAIGLRQRGNAWRVRGRLSQAVEELTQALTLARTTPSASLKARVLTDLAVARFVSGHLDPALEGLEEALTLARACDDRATLVETLAYAAIVRFARHEPAEAIVHCDEALPLARERGDRLNEARLLGTMGNIFHDQGRLELAHAFLKDAVARCRAIREVRLQGYFLGKLAHLQLERGELSRAHATLQEALGLLSDVGDVRHEGLFLTYLAALEASRGHTEAARTAVGSAKVRLESVKDPLLLTAHALRSMAVELKAANASRTEAQALLDDVKAPRGNRRARVDQSEEVRLAASMLEKLLRTP
ncbi:MAG: protein kinase domain-containing protein [Myxococcota bacterium]